VPSGLKPRYGVYPLTPALRLGLVTIFSKLGFSPDSACTEPVEVPDLQSVGQQTCSDYLLSTPKNHDKPRNQDIKQGERQQKFPAKIHQLIISEPWVSRPYPDKEK